MSYDTGKSNKGFNYSYTIPKRNQLESGNMYQQSTSVLAGAYSNTTSSYPNYVQNYTNQAARDWNDFIRRPYPDSNMDTMQANSMQNQEQKPLKRTWLVANKPTTNMRYKDTFGDLHDNSLPKDLLLLFQPLFCKLCMIQLSSNTMAKLHYCSKNHDKKVRAWLIEYSEKTGEPLHKRAVLPRGKTDEEYDPKYYHCDVCDIALTGKIHAESHYMGKNHQRALWGKKDPSGKGYYNEEGKWIRTENANKKESAQDGFGRDFGKAPPTSTRTTVGLKCDICNVSVTSIPQLEAHYQGQKHKKKLKHIEDGMTIAPVNGDVDSLNEAVVKKNPDILASYRTPSGQFYCKTCNLSMNSEVQFMQHLKSKKHAKKLAPPPTEPQPVTSADDIFEHL